MIIYVIYNVVDGKLYVGKTKNSLEHRMRHHFSSCKRGKNSSKLLYEAVRKEGGWDNFIWHEIDYAETYEELNEKERFWIRKLKTQETGYNIGFGGDGGDNFTYHPNMEEVKKRLSDGVKNSQRWTDEKRSKQSERTHKWNMEHLDFLRQRMFGDGNPMSKEEYRNKLVGGNNPMKKPENREKQLKAVQSDEHRKLMSMLKTGSKMPPRTPEHRKKLSEARKGKRMPDSAKEKISEFNKGKVLKESTKKLISEKITGIIRSDETRRKLSELRTSILFLQFDKNGKYLGRYLGKRELFQKTGVRGTNVKDYRFVKNRMAGGFKWIKLNVNEITEEEIQEICRKGL